MRWIFCATACFVLLISLLAPPASAAVTAEQRAKANELVELMRQAGKFFSEGDFEQSAEKVAYVQTQLVELLKTRDRALDRLAQPVYSQLARAHGLLELEGIELELLPSWDVLTKASEPATPTDQVSFQKDLAPWLVSRCGNCHINNARGQFSMATYATLMKGSAAGVVLFPGSARGSRLVEVLESGDMPRGGGPISADQLAQLSKWIDQGAKFDGDDPETPLSNLVNASDSVPSLDPAAQMATGNETVSFATQIAPILIKNCNGCHIAGRQASGGLRMDTFTQLLRGGDTGPVMIPENDTDSLLVRKIKGESGQRMPAGGRPPLAEAEIKLIATWIREGAKFDGPAVSTDIGDVASAAWATNASHSELFESRKQRAMERWKKVLPNDSPSQASNDQFLVLGNVPQARLDGVLEQLTAAAEKVQQQLRTPANEPLIHGGMAVYALKSRYDYSEFGRMSENRELPKDWLGHWQADVVDVYGVLAADPPLEDDLAQALAVQIIAGGFLGSHRGVPTWFAEGIARNLVFTSYRRGNPRVLAWQQNVPVAVLKLKDSKNLLEGKLDEEAAGLVGMQLTGSMLNRANRRRFDKLLELLREGQSFDQALTTTFAPAEVLLKTWLGK